MAATAARSKGKTKTKNSSTGDGGPPAATPPEHASDPAFERIGQFWVRRSSGKPPAGGGDPDIGVRQRTRLLELSALFGADELRTVVAPLVSNKPNAAGEPRRVSLRSLDWLCTNYSKRKFVTLLGHSRFFLIHYEYKAWLRTWRRRLFDPFARRERVFFRVRADAGAPWTWFATTPAQLNFIFFASRMGVIEYTRRHLTDIEKDNTSALARAGRAPAAAAGAKRKRTALSKTPLISVAIIERPVEITWD